MLKPKMKRTKLVCFRLSGVKDTLTYVRKSIRESAEVSPQKGENGPKVCNGIGSKGG